MSRFFRTHAEWFLIAAGILFAAVIIFFMVWGVGLLAEVLGASLANPRPAGRAQEFNIEGASKIDFRGLRE